MAFWNKSKNKETVNFGEVLETSSQDLSDDMDLDDEDEVSVLPEDSLTTTEDVETAENDLMEVDRMSDNDLFTAISRNAEIVGNIVTSDNLEVFGTIQGNINSEALVKIYGTVNGHIQCDTLIASGARITGDITCRNLVEIRANTDIQGDIACNSSIVSGDLVGNITAEISTSLSGTAVVTGNISTPEFEVAKGAVLNGSVSIQKDLPKVTELNTTPIAVAVQSDLVTETQLLDDDHLLDEILEEAK